MKKLILFLSSALLVGAAVAAVAADPPKPGADIAIKATNDDEQIIHLLNRTCFGPRPGDINRVKQMGIQAYIEEQLNPQKIADPFDGNDRPEILAMREDPMDGIRQYRQFKQGKKQKKKAAFEVAQDPAMQPDQK